MEEYFKYQVEKNNKSNSTFWNWFQVLSEEVINKINKLIIENQKEMIFRKLETLKQIWFSNYKKCNSNEEKENIIEISLYNIVKLLNEINYIEVYNTDSVLSKEKDYYCEVKYIDKITNICWKIDIDKEWWDCNSFLLLVYSTIKSITDNDENIKYNFITKKQNNHWILIIQVGEKKYLYHRQSKHILKKVNEDSLKIYKKKYIINNNLWEYFKTKNEIWYNQNKIAFRHWWEYLRIKRKYWVITMIIKWNNKKNKDIWIHWLKKITKKILGIKNLTIIWLFPKKYKLNYNDIREILISKIWKEEDKNFFNYVFDKLNKTKLENIFNN